MLLLEQSVLAEAVPVIQQDWKVPFRVSGIAPFAEVLENEEWLRAPRRKATRPGCRRMWAPRHPRGDANGLAIPARCVTIFQGIPLPTASQGLDLAVVSLWSPSCFLNPTPGTEFLFGRPAFPLVAGLRLDQGSSVPGSNSAWGQTIALRVSICPSCRARPIYPPERDRASSGIREAIAWLTVSQLSRLQPCGPGASPGGRCCATIPMSATRACALRLSRASGSTRSTRWPLPSGACAPVRIRFPRTCSLRRSLNGLTHEGSQDVGPTAEAGRAGRCRCAGGNARKRRCVGCVTLAGRAHLPKVATQPGPAGLSGSATELAEL